MAVDCISLTVVFILVAVLLPYMLSVWNSKRKRLPPGPLGVPVIGHLHLVGPLVHRSFAALSSRYGPIMSLRLGSISCVVASTPELAREFLNTHESTFSSRKRSFAIDYVTYNAAFTFAPYGSYWIFIKRLAMTELLGTQVQHRFVPLRTRELHCLLLDLYRAAEAGQAVNLSKKLVNLTNNVISQMILGMRCSEDEDRATGAAAVIREVTQILGEYSVSHTIWFFQNLDLQGFRKRLQDIHRRYDALLERIITEREQLREKEGGGKKLRHKDFLDIMLDVLESEENSEFKLTRNHIKALVLDFFTAGTDTSAILLEWALAELINHPAALHKARQEIESLTKNERLVGETDSQKLPYVLAVIKETLRLHPSVPLLARKSTADCEVAGYAIPAGTVLFVNVWSMGRDPNIWDDPLEFRPERFFEAGDVDVRGHHFQLLPFGTGRRGCPGVSLAMQELPAMLAAMIQCFHWDVVEADGTAKIETKGPAGLVDMSERPGLTAPRANDLLCVPRPRFDLTQLLQLSSLGHAA